VRTWPTGFLDLLARGNFSEEEGISREASRHARCAVFFLVVVLFAMSLSPGVAAAQDEPPQREVNHLASTWIGLFTNHRFGDHWGVSTDFLIQRNQFLSEPGLYWVRLGGGYFFNDQVSLTGGLGRVWIYAPQLRDGDFFVENRVDAQILKTSALGKFLVVQRFRTDLRWREFVEGDETTDRVFSIRPRYLASFTLPVSRNPKVPMPVVASEILVQFGTGLANNTFDQARLFVGINHRLGKGFSYDFGYFQLFQRTAGGAYNANHKLRFLMYFGTRGGGPDINAASMGMSADE
jgi:hypothetical protein